MLSYHVNGEGSLPIWAFLLHFTFNLTSFFVGRLASVGIKLRIRVVLVLVLDKFWSNRDLKMLCTGMSSKHHSWEPEVEVILSVIVSFIILCTQMWA